MKRSARFMVLGIGIILAGILGFLLMEDQTSNGSILLWYIGQGLPLLGALAGPILLVVGFFIKDDKK